MCSGNAIAATQKQLAAASPPFAQAMAAPAEAEPSFDFRGFSPLDLRVTSEQGRENLDRLNSQMPVAPALNLPGSAAQKDYEAKLAAWQRSVSTQQKQLTSIKEEEYRRDAPRRLADERNALIAQQQAEMLAYERQMADQQDRQAEQAAGLQAQHNERVTGIRARGSAVAQSLQVLGQKGLQAPTAQMTKRTNAQQGARTTSASLRMGSTSAGAGSGANISV